MAVRIFTLAVGFFFVAVFALAPIQDFLSLGNAARMNYPGNPSGNWTWRMPPTVLNPGLMEGIREFNYIYDRMNPLTLERKQAQMEAEKGKAADSASATNGEAI